MQVDIVELNNQRRFPSKSDTQLIAQHPPPLPPPHTHKTHSKNKTNKKENYNKINDFFLE